MYRLCPARNQLAPRTVAVQMDVDEKAMHRGVERNTAANIIQGLAERLKAVKAKTQ